MKKLILIVFLFTSCTTHKYRDVYEFYSCNGRDSGQYIATYNSTIGPKHPTIVNTVGSPECIAEDTVYINVCDFKLLKRDTLN